MKNKIEFNIEDLKLLKNLCCKSGNFELASKVRQIERQKLKLPKDKKVYVKPPSGKWINVNEISSQQGSIMDITAAMRTNLFVDTNLDVIANENTFNSEKYFDNNK